MKNQALITAAITGAIHTPTMSPYLPVAPEDIAAQAIQAANEGAAEVHVHARDPEDGRPSADLTLFREIFEEIKEQSDVIICVTTGGGKDMTVEERMSSVSSLKPELASLNMGSMNFGMFPMAERPREWKHEWEKPFLESTRDFIFRNTFNDIETALHLMREHGTKPELEVYDVGQLYTLQYFLERDLLDSPIYIQFVTGILGGIGADIENLIYLKSTADRLFGRDTFHWSAIGSGRMQFPICTTAALLGGHCRVGLEDNLYLEKGVLAESNAALVRKMKRILKEFGLEAASASDARTALGLA